MAASRDESLQQEKNNTYIKTYSDDLGIENGVGAAAVLFRHGVKKCTLYFYLSNMTNHTVYKGELVRTFSHYSYYKERG
jgi:hypothetical protein